jgi:hypothetical protein
MAARLIFCILVYAASFPAFAQSSKDSVWQWKPEGMISGNYKDFYRDNLDNIYLLSASGQVKKYNVHGDSTGVFNDVRKYGSLYSMDVNNPLKLILYYKDFNTIITLDRFLNVQNVIDLKKNFLTQVRAVALSYDNNIWLFDELENKLKKLDDKGNILLQSNDFRLVFNDTVMPGHIIDANGKLYLYDTAKGWFIFDYYGAFQQKIPYAGWEDVMVEKDLLSGVSDNYTINLFNQRTAHIETTELPVLKENSRKVRYQQNQLMVLTNSALYFYSLNAAAAQR